MRPSLASIRSVKGFTLIELLVVITIIVVLAALSMVGIGMFMERGRKVQAMAQFRDLETGLKAFETEVQRPMLPPDLRASGTDTVFGDPDGQYSNDFIVTMLNGEADTPWRGREFDIKQVNPRGDTFVQLKYTDKKRNGVGRDGLLYDPWGNEIIIGINAYKGSQNDAPLRDEASGSNDRILYTYGIGEYTDTKPREISFAMWSFGADGKKGDGAVVKTARVPYSGSDDVISWR
jgi:prepilin-type N-terminal cleavage/methylation domain-containing protein